MLDARMHTELLRIIDTHTHTRRRTQRCKTLKWTPLLICLIVCEGKIRGRNVALPKMH